MFLNRYTTLPVLLDFLRRKKLVLLDPASWEDRNDSQILAEYKRRQSIDKIFALCFSHGTETIHHWKTYSDGISGCCIQLHGEQMLKIFEAANLRHGPVKYRKLQELERNPIDVSEIPFTKRWPYRCEEEYRIIWEGSSSKNYFELDVPLKCINRITINQRMPHQVFQTIRDYLRAEVINPDKRINRSTLFENDVWIDKFRNA